MFYCPKHKVNQFKNLINTLTNNSRGSLLPAHFRSGMKIEPRPPLVLSDSITRLSLGTFHEFYFCPWIEYARYFQERSEEEFWKQKFRPLFLGIDDYYGMDSNTRQEVLFNHMVILEGLFKNNLLAPVLTIFLYQKQNEIFLQKIYGVDYIINFLLDVIENNSEPNSDLDEFVYRQLRSSKSLKINLGPYF